MRKIEPVGKGSFIRRILRALGKASGFGSPTPSRQEKNTGVSAYSTNYDFHKTLTNSMLEAEQSKAKAIMWHQMRDLPR